MPGVEGEGVVDENEEEEEEAEGDDEATEGMVEESKRQMKKRKRLEKQMALMPKGDKQKARNSMSCYPLFPRIPSKVHPSELGR